MKTEDVKEILYQQLLILAEKSKICDIDTVIKISAEMDRIADTLLRD